ncbi:Uncharacterised protein [Moraxella caviae]|uniref:Uncharacterized protein n=1 Tax=Moraxella caviae TaxID=34060 RepID=A0A378R9K9_9GAMM|nr:Uncharacterised protein [Moraxella caviae]VEW14022.1 Uncharacterised protein [Moraxella caviae]
MLGEYQAQTWGEASHLYFAKRGGALCLMAVQFRLALCIDYIGTQHLLSPDIDGILIFL